MRNDHDKPVWIPEAPKHSGLYANATELAPNKIGSEKEPSTFNVHCAMQFETEAECKEWCDKNPIPEFKPMQHEFVDMKTSLSFF